MYHHNTSIHLFSFTAYTYAALKVVGGLEPIPAIIRQDTRNKSPEPTYRAKQDFKLAFTSTDNLETPIHNFGP